MQDAAFSPDGSLLASLHSDVEGYIAAARDMTTGEIVTLPFHENGDAPYAIWVEASNEALWLEVLPLDPETAPYVVRLPLDGGDSESFASVASNPSAIVRIGRIPPPLAVTASVDGLVSLFDLERAELVASAQVDGVPQFGRINELGGNMYLAWSDSSAESLHLLNFATGEDRVVAPLEGAYIQAVLLAPAGDVILGVNVDFEPIILAWLSETGERIDLGAYRECSRTPDMARLSTDGRTLAVGCDTGLEFWRVGGAAHSERATAS